MDILVTMSSYTSSEEAKLASEFLERGYVIRPAEDLVALDGIKTLVSDGISVPLDEFRTPPSALNGLKLRVMEALKADWVRPAYFSLAKNLLHQLVGNELAMQRRLNLSVQLPDDAGALLPLHADTWTGDSPFEVVLWVPLVDCRDTQSMFYLDHFIEIKYGEVMIFDLSIPHGNVVNRTPRTRWSLNCRFKALFTPYADKKLGEFFEPISLKAASEAGLR